MAGQHAPVGEVREGDALGEVGPAGLGLIVGHFVLLERRWAAWETSDAMSTSPALVCLGEPLIEFNRPREGDGRTWLQGFGGDSQNVAIAAARQGAAAGYLPSLGQDWLGDAFLELWRSQGGDAARVGPHPRAPPRVSLLTPTDPGPKLAF